MSLLGHRIHVYIFLECWFVSELSELPKYICVLRAKDPTTTMLLTG